MPAGDVELDRMAAERGEVLLDEGPLQLGKPPNCVPKSGSILLRPAIARAATSNAYGTTCVKAPDISGVHHSPRGTPLQNNPLDLIERNLVVAAIAKLGRARAFMRRHLRGVFEQTPIEQIDSDASRAETVAADAGKQAGFLGAANDHAAQASASLDSDTRAHAASGSVAAPSAAVDDTAAAPAVRRQKKDQ